MFSPEDVADQDDIDPVAGEHEARHPANVVDAHGDRALALLEQRRQRGSLAGSRDFGLKDQLVALNGCERDAAAVLEEFLPGGERPLRHLARGPLDLRDIVAVEFGAESDRHRCHDDRARGRRRHVGVRGDPVARQKGRDAAHRDGEEKD